MVIQELLALGWIIHEDFTLWRGTASAVP